MGQLSEENRRKNILAHELVGMITGDDGVPDYDKLDQVLLKAKVPPGLCDVRLNDVPDRVSAEKLKEKSKDWFDGNRRMVGVVIEGPGRSGKSTLAAGVARFFARRHRPVAWRRAVDLVERNYELTRNDDVDYDEAMWERWHLEMVYDLLVIDAFEATALTDYSSRFMQNLVHCRADYGLYTVITTSRLPESTVTEDDGFDTDQVRNSLPIAADSLLEYLDDAYYVLGAQRVAR